MCPVPLHCPCPPVGYVPSLVCPSSIVTVDTLFPGDFFGDNGHMSCRRPGTALEGGFRRNTCRWVPCTLAACPPAWMVCCDRMVGAATALECA